MSTQNNSSYGSNMSQLEQSAGESLERLLQNRARMIGLATIVLVFLWITSGIYIVQPGEEGVVKTFGRFSSVATSGLNYHIPWPIQSVTIVDVANVRRAEIGFRSEGQNDRAQVLGEALMLTADENIVQVELLIQYRIADSPAFVFNVQDPEDVLRTSAEVGLRSTVGNMTIDAVITEERARVQDETRVFLSQLMEDYRTGIQVSDVRLQVADPPAEVRDAFQEVVRALADKERLINEAEAYQNDIVPRARGEKQRLIEEATAFKDESILRATGDAERFASILDAYQIAPDVTRERMHIEALENILSRIELVLLDGGSIGGQVVPFLPLGDLTGADSTKSDPLPHDSQSTPAEGGE